MKLLIATHNPGKVKTSRILFERLGIMGVSLQDVLLPHGQSSIME
ncbi:hypothetical protein [Hazenella coriacea]|uniref:Non-canonical purine NTP pyrophosphatase n=1 Tax=Hazenella coriacea TaxID=1179467 RepID=A0A4R3L4R4_9BACL|nr:hypothetical protein [Hazenella coriacea]TCS93114.1 hypothetical protein EDD58_10956 [Hazenella coriacea]